MNLAWGIGYCLANIVGIRKNVKVWYLSFGKYGFGLLRLDERPFEEFEKEVEATERGLP